MRTKYAIEVQESTESKELLGESELPANHDARVTATRSGKFSTNQETQGKDSSACTSGPCKR